MNKEEKDIRYQRTHKSILQAMIELLKVKNFDQITVKDICEQAQISRSGFYLHYLDKFDLVEKYQLYFIRESNERITKERSRSRHDFTLLLLHYLKDEGQLMSLLLSSNGSSEIQNNMKQMMQKNARDFILPYIDISLTNSTEERYFLVFLSNAMLGVVQEWINSNQKETPEDIVKLLDKIIKFDFRQ